MKAKTKKRIRAHFDRTDDAVFSASDLARILNEHRIEWEAFDVSAREMTKFLIERSLLRSGEFTSNKYRPFIRYVHGSPSAYRLALSLRHDSFLSHGTALTIHQLAEPNSTIYVNKEQASKPDSGGLTQAGIRLAFKNQQRSSKYIFQFDRHHYVLLNGKNTKRAGVARIRTPDGDDVDSTDLERTLIDIAVRPAYAGGLEKVASVYEVAFSKVDLDHLTDLLGKLNYLYPYAQSIGFLLQRAGRPEKDLKGLEKLRSEFDFFLDYGLKEPSYDKKWRLYYPAKIGNTSS